MTNRPGRLVDAPPPRSAGVGRLSALYPLTP
jgi:hypothetical protein